MTNPRRRLPIEMKSLVLLAVIVLGVWAFAALASEVLERETTAFDTRVLLSLRAPGNPAVPIGGPALQEFMRDLTALGGTWTLTILTLIVSIGLVLQRHGRTALFLVVSVASGAAVSTLFKHLISRPRPELVPHGSFVNTASFPSGHSMMAAVTYLTLAVVISRFQTRRAVKVYVLTVATFLAIAVGISRIYLGVHWPTDVLAGWALGAAWAMGAWVVIDWLDRRRLVDPAPPEQD